MENDVTVVTVDDTLNVPIDVSRAGDVTLVRVRAGKIRRAPKIVRAINEIRLSRIIWKAARVFFETHPCDLLIGYSPTIFWSDLSDRIKALNGCNRYLIMRDIFPQWAVDAGLLSRHGPAYWYFRRQELRLYRSFDVIGVESAANLAYYAAPPLGGRYDVEVLYNWTSIGAVQPVPFGLRDRYSLQDKVIFMYGGNLGVAQDMDNILRLAGNLKDEKEISFLLVGDGSEADRLKREIERQKLGNVLLHPAVSQEEYMRILAECDVGLITLNRDLKTFNLPGKMLGYMELRKPMLASVNPGNELKSIVRDHKIGLVCDNGEDEILCKYALQLARDCGLRQDMGERAHVLLKEKFDVSKAAKQILVRYASTD